MTLSLFDFLVLLGIAQGLYTGVLLLFSQDRKLQSKLLAMILFTFLLLSCKILMHTLGWWSTSTFRYFPLAVDLLLQPLIYLYVRAVVRPEKEFERRDFVHFIPVAVFFVHALVVYIQVQSVSTMEAKDAIANTLFYNAVKYFEDFLSVISAWMYGILSYRNLQQYRQWLHDNVSDERYPAYTWLRNVLVSFAILVGVLTLNILIDRAGLMFFGFYHWQVFYIVIAMVVYYMGFQGYYLRSVPSPVAQQQKKDTTVAYPAEAVEQTIKKVIEAMQIKKIYRDPGLSLVKLADAIEVPVGLVSYAINTSMKVNFRNLVNLYRVEEMKTSLHDPNLKHLSVLGLALDCGFNSEASFYRIFKHTTGKTPKEYVAHSAE